MTDYASVIESSLKAMGFPEECPRLYEPVAYTLAGGGKRLRPLLALVCAAACGVAPEKMLPQALAIEMFHNFTLIHDDVMDRSDTRRGRPTVFARDGAVRAILSGDALLTLATMKMAENAGDLTARLLDMFNRTALAVYEGQQLDTDFESAAPGTVSEQDYIDMILRKTAALIVLPCLVGPTVAGNDTARAALREYAIHLGLAFQLRDDWLDTFGDAATFGKPIGGDIRNRKHTLLFIRAWEKAPEAMKTAYDLADPVAAVTAIYRELGLDTAVQDLIDSECDKACHALNSAPLDSEHKEWLLGLARSLSTRTK
ncbi:MAG: polyprenyl synthetase family protein [Muribaculaceae bacterium]|nr:polyprenyl synthetase family protein [Muribaculaceae bacterium]